MEPESHVDPPMHLIKPVVEIEKIYDQDQDVSPVTIQLDIPRVVVPINHSQGTEYPTAASFIQGMAANDR